jgi:two-component system, OmpR family, phosphate regulon sensor histidine kinase PhoR
MVKVEEGKTDQGDDQFSLDLEEQQSEADGAFIGVASLGLIMGGDPRVETVETEPVSFGDDDPAAGSQLEEEIRQQLLKELEDRVQKNAALFTEALVHDIKGPVSLLGTLTYFLSRAREKGDLSLLDKAIAQLTTVYAALSEAVHLSGAHLLGVERTSTSSKGLADAVNSRFKHDPRRAESVEFLVSSAGEQHILVGQKRVSVILGNLIENAMAHTTQGQIRVSITQTSEQLTLEVSDDGCGIPQESIPRIYEKHMSLPEEETPRRPEIKSTGKGLYFVDHLVRQMDGSIEVQSVVGQGTTFIVRIPTQLVL